MERFDSSDQADPATNRRASERLSAFFQAVWNALVPGSGPCASVQGELVRAQRRLTDELLRNGMGNYFHRESPAATLGDNHYGAMAIFLLDTLVANRGGALEDGDVAYFARARSTIEAEWLRGLRSDELYYAGDERELTDAEQKELEALDAQPRGPAWEDLMNRAERCIANYCLANAALVDRDGNRVVEGGVRDVMHVFSPPPAPPPCALCGGKGWIEPKSTNEFPSLCSCKKA